MTTDEVIKVEIESIINDIIKVYNDSGRRASGEFAEGLEAIYEPNKGTIKGYLYLAGHGPTKKKDMSGEPTVEQILKWIKIKGIKPLEEKTSLKSLAFLIARKIHREGTDRSKWLKIYEQVITPERIDSIIDRVSTLNVNKVVTEFKAKLEVFEKGV